MLYTKYEDKDSDGNDRVIALYRSYKDPKKPSNLPKTIYYPSRNILFVYFIRERPNKKARSPKDAKRNELFLGGKIYTGSVYEMSNLPSEKYSDFEKAFSQGSHYRTYISTDETVLKSGNFELTPQEIHELLEQFAI